MDTGNGHGEPLARSRDGDPFMLAGYRSFATPSRVLVRGRAMEDEGITPAGEKDSVWRNLLNSYRRIESDPLPFARIRATVGAASQEIVADDEGFFHKWIDASTNPDETGEWVRLSLELVSPTRSGAPPVTCEMRAVLPPPSARFAVISDMDDTVLQSHVTSITQAIRTTVLGNARTRLPFPGVAAFYRALREGAAGDEKNPIFYVSSSPWNLYDLLIEFLQLQEIPAGPMTLRDWDIDRSAIGSGRLHGFKDAAIREIMDAYPSLPVILIGDSSQRDPEIYREVVRANPDRVLAVYIRDVRRTAERRGAIAALAAEVQAARSVLVLADDTMAAARHAAERGWIDAKSLDSIRGEKRMDEGAVPGKTGIPVVTPDAPTNAPTVIDGGPGGPAASGEPPRSDP
jgi:phosphatidate phosphatase APP1